MAGTETLSVKADELYTLEQLKWRLNLSNASYRALRDAGLPEICRGKRKYFLGRRVIEWFDDPGVRDSAAQSVNKLPPTVEDRA